MWITMDSILISFRHECQRNEKKRSRKKLFNIRRAYKFINAEQCARARKQKCGFCHVLISLFLSMADTLCSSLHIFYLSLLALPPTVVYLLIFFTLQEKNIEYHTFIKWNLEKRMNCFPFLFFLRRMEHILNLESR